MIVVLGEFRGQIGVPKSIGLEFAERRVQLESPPFCRSTLSGISTVCSFGLGSYYGSKYCISDGQ